MELSQVFVPADGRHRKAVPTKTTKKEAPSPFERQRYVATLERDVFVGDFWARGAGGEGVVGVSGLILVFRVRGACTGASGHAVALSAEHAHFVGNDFC